MGNTDRLRTALALALLLVLSDIALAASVRLLKQDATVWARTVHLKGLADPSLGTAGSVIVNGVAIPVSVAAPGDTFHVDIPIAEGANAVVADSLAPMDIRTDRPGWVDRAEEGHVRLVVYDILGREVATLVDGLKEPGGYTVGFDASRLASGMYLARVEAGGRAIVRKMLLMR